MMQHFAKSDTPTASSFSAPRMTNLKIIRQTSNRAFASFGIFRYEASREEYLVANSVCEEVADLCCDLPCMGLEREMARVEVMDYGTGNIAPERLGTARQEKRVVLSPDCQETWLVSPEIVLEGRVKRDVALVVAQQVQLNLVGTRAGQIEVVE